MCYAVLQIMALPVLRPEGSCGGTERARWVRWWLLVFWMRAVLVGKAPVCYAVLRMALPVLRPEGSCCSAERARWVQFGHQASVRYGGAGCHRGAQADPALGASPGSRRNAWERGLSARYAVRLPYGEIWEYSSM